MTSSTPTDPLRLKGQVFGPGYPVAGAILSFSADEHGLSVETHETEDGSPRWDEIVVQSAGWDGRHLRLEWARAVRSYSIAVGEAEAAQLRRLADRQGALRKGGAGRRSATFAVFIIVAALGVPLALVGGLIWQHERLLGWAVSYIPIEQEAKLGEMFFEQQKARLRLVDGPALEMVRGIGSRLTQSSRYRYQFYVAEEASANAFAMPGGLVVLHTGLLRLAGSPEEVAGVWRMKSSMWSSATVCAEWRSPSA